MVAGGHTFHICMPAALVVVLALVLFAPPARAQVPCPGSPAPNEIVCENRMPGSPPSEWEVLGAGDLSIQGFATDISVNQGQTVRFKVDTDASDYRLDIYRMGWYGGNGARRVATVQPSASLPQNQPSCPTDPTGLIDCGNWSESASWLVPPSAVSGIYFARLVREDGTAGASHVPFIVRDDDGLSHLLFQTSDTTWQAYNNYGGNSLYQGGPGTDPNRAYKVSYNRPFNTGNVDGGQDWVFNAEYPMVRWLERNGYDVSYFTGVDSDRRGVEIRDHRAFLSVGHDEYWSGVQRANVEAARNAGVNLAFFSGNEVFWKTRWENNHRTLVSYKETHANRPVGQKIDPTPFWTGTWRDPRFSPPADGGRPENALTGQLFMVNDGATTAIRVPAADGKMRFWRNTSVAALAAGATATLPDETLGYEWDEDVDNGHRPAGSFRMSSTTVAGAPVLQDYGSEYDSGVATHHLTLYRNARRALVFGAGTVQWSWGLDGEHDPGPSTPSAAMQQATVNLFADMLVQPGTLQPGLIRAAASADRTPPTSAPSLPTRVVSAGNPVTVNGTAVDRGGGRVGGVEVSVDGGATWHPATTGRESWSYTFTPTASGRVTIRSRAADDSGNLEGRDEPAAVPPGVPPTSAPPSNPSTGSSDRVAPRVRVRPRRVRATRRGLVRLRVTCPRSETMCRVDLRLRRAGSTLARKRFQVRGGRTRRLAFRLNRSNRRRLARSGSLRLTAAATARDLAANRATTRTRIRVLAPRRS